MIFSGPMVNAIRDGRKTQTRRAVRFRPGFEPGGLFCRLGTLDTNGSISSRVDHLGHCVYHTGWAWQTEHGWCNCRPATYAPPAMPGDLLYVKQPWAAFDLDWRWMDEWREAPRFENRYMRIPETTCDAEPKEFKWRSARFMPKRAAQLRLRVTDVRVERVRDISDDGVDAEFFGGDIPHNLDGAHRKVCQLRGSPDYECACGDYSMRELFAIIWDDINAKRGFGWELNPWVWVVSFERTTPTAGGSQ